MNDKVLNIIFSISLLLVGLSFLLQSYVGVHLFQLFMFICFVTYFAIFIVDILKYFKFKDSIKVAYHEIGQNLFFGVLFVFLLIGTEFENYFVFWYSKVGLGVLLLINAFLKLIMYFKIKKNRN